MKREGSGNGGEGREGKGSLRLNRASSCLTAALVARCLCVPSMLINQL